MNYNIISLTTLNPDGSLTRFENGALGQVLVGVSASQLPQWKSLADANIAAADHNHSGVYVPLTGNSTISGTITATGFVGNLTGTASEATHASSADTALTAESATTAGSATIAGTANQVANALSITLGSSGTATDYDGSQAVSITITPESIGAALSNHSHPYLPLAGGVMTGAVSTSIIESNGRYYGVAWADGAASTTKIIVNTSIAANSNGGILPEGETFYQVHLTGLDENNKAKTLDITIGLSITPSGGITTSKSGWSTAGTVQATKIEYDRTTTNKYILVITVPSGKYRVNVDVFCDYVAVKDQFFPTNVATYLSGWTIAANTTTGLSLSDLGSATNYPLVSHTHVKADITDFSHDHTITALTAGTTAADKILVSITGNAASWKTLSEAGIAPTSHASTTTTYGASSATSYGHAKATTTTPKADTESGSLGTEVDSFARGDHAHPTPMVVEFAKRFATPRGIGLTGAVTAEVTEYSGDSDSIIRVTAIDPDFITNAVPIAKGGTGATTAVQALTNLGAAASSHNHSISNITSGITKGGLVVGSSTTALTFISPVAVGKILGSAGTNTSPQWYSPSELGLSKRIKDVIEVHDGASGLDGSYHSVSVTAGHDSEVWVIAGANVSSSTSAYNPQIMLQAPTVNSGGDKIEINFISMAPASVNSALQINFSNNARTIFYKNNIVTTVQQHGNALTIAKGEKLVLNAIHYPTASDDLFWMASKVALSNI